MEEVAFEQLLTLCGIYLCIYVSLQWSVRSLTCMYAFLLLKCIPSWTPHSNSGVGTITGSPFTDKEKALRG